MQKNACKVYEYIIKSFLLWHDSEDPQGCCRPVLQVFAGSECQVKILATSHCTISSIRQIENNRSVVLRNSAGHTRASVQSPLVVLLKRKVRKGGDFFYGKSGNENYSEGV